MPPDTRRASLLHQAIALEIDVLLTRRRMTALDLARKVGMSQSAMSRRMVGDQPFDTDELERIADVLEVDPHDLLPPRRRGEPPLTTRSYAPTVSGTVPHPRHPIVAAAVPIQPSGPRRTAPTGL